MECAREKCNPLFVLLVTHVARFRVGTRPATRRHPAGFRSYNHPPSPLKTLVCSLLFQKNSLFYYSLLFSSLISRT